MLFFGKKYSKTKNPTQAHSLSSFAKDLKAFTAVFVSGGGSMQTLVNDFIAKMKKDYNITVTFER